MLEWFLLIIYKKHTQGNIYKPFNRNHFTLHFLLRREGRQMRNTEQLPYQTDKRSRRRSFFKKAVLKNFAMFMGKYLCWCLFLIKPQTFRTSTLLKTLVITCFREIVSEGFLTSLNFSRMNHVNNTH